MTFMTPIDVLIPKMPFSCFFFGPRQSHLACWAGNRRAWGGGGGRGGVLKMCALTTPPPFLEH